MEFGKIGLNLTAIENISTPDFGMSGLTTAEVVQQIPVKTNEVTGDLYGVVVLIALLIYLMIMLADQSPYGRFRYSKIRTLGISLGICIQFGIVLISIGFMTDYIILVRMTAAYALMVIYVYLKNPN